MTEVKNALAVIRSKGVIALAITGGEPFLWRDGDNTVEDVVSYARSIGFATVCIYTNGTLPLNSSADILFVGVDKFEQNSFTVPENPAILAIKNIEKSNHPYIALNATINNLNYEHIGQYLISAQAVKNIRAIFFYLHTPYYGKDDLTLTPENRTVVINDIIGFKKNKFPIINSFATLNGVLKNDWPRPSKHCVIYGEGRFWDCCRAESNIEACNNCGYLGYAELEYVARLNIGAILNALRYAS
jgi:MoaA/NifB/PqqE/SkfB family radical SAM enzyme